MISVNPGRPFSCSYDIVERDPDTYRSAVGKAVELVGGPDELARRLRVPLSELERWIAGTSEPSMGAFLKVIDILLEEGPKPRFHAKKD